MSKRRSKMIVPIGVTLIALITIASTWYEWIQKEKEKTAKKTAEAETRDLAYQKDIEEGLWQERLDNKGKEIENAIKDQDDRTLYLVQMMNQLISNSGKQLIIDDVLSAVHGKITPEGLLLHYRLKFKLGSLKAIWHFNPFDASFGPSFGGDIVIEGLPVDAGEHSFIVSLDGMARGQTIPFELKGFDPYVRARHDIRLEDGFEFQIIESDIVSDKVIVK
jgi:hypothetical protein